MHYPITRTFCALGPRVQDHFLNTVIEQLQTQPRCPSFISLIKMPWPQERMDKLVWLPSWLKLLVLILCELRDQRPPNSLHLSNTYLSISL